MQNEQLWHKLEEDYEVEKRWTLREIAIGLIAGNLYDSKWLAVFCHSYGQVRIIERRAV